MNIDLDAAFVIPNTVRNLAGKKEEIHRFALNDKLMVNCYAGYTESAPPCHSEHREESRLERPRRSSLGPRAVSRRSSEQGERKSGCPSEASYLIFRPASVAKACEAHEALTFWLLLGQAKSDKKRDSSLRSE